MHIIMRGFWIEKGCLRHNYDASIQVKAVSLSFCQYFKAKYQSIKYLFIVF